MDNCIYNGYVLGGRNGQIGDKRNCYPAPVRKESLDGSQKRSRRQQLDDGMGVLGPRLARFAENPTIAKKFRNVPSGRFQWFLVGHSFHAWLTLKFTGQDFGARNNHETLSLLSGFFQHGSNKLAALSKASVCVPFRSKSQNKIQNIKFTAEYFFNLIGLKDHIHLQLATTGDGANIRLVFMEKVPMEKTFGSARGLGDRPAALFCWILSSAWLPLQQWPWHHKTSTETNQIWGQQRCHFQPWKC